MQTPYNSNKRTLTLPQLRKIWNTKGCSYTDEELIQIGDFVLMITEVIVETHREQKRKQSILEVDKKGGL